MWFLIVFQLASIPHTLHILGGRSGLSLDIIIDFTLWFKLAMSVLLVVGSVATATVVSNVSSTIPVSNNSAFSTKFDVLILAILIDQSPFLIEEKLLALFGFSAKVRKDLRLSWETFASP